MATAGETVEPIHALAALQPINPDHPVLTECYFCRTVTD